MPLVVLCLPGSFRAYQPPHASVSPVVHGHCLSPAPVDMLVLSSLQDARAGGESRQSWAALTATAGPPIHCWLEIAECWADQRVT